MNIKRALAAVAVSVAVALVGAGTATAGSFYHSTHGAKFDGSYKFEPKATSQGAFHFWGTLDDTLKDTDAVKLQVRVHGYGYNTWYAPEDADIYLNKMVYDGATQQTNYARAKVCRDRGALLPDNCSTEKRYDR